VIIEKSLRNSAKYFRKLARRKPCKKEHKIGKTNYLLKIQVLAKT